jgi:hypothetical protein
LWLPITQRWEPMQQEVSRFRMGNVLLKKRPLP